MSGKVRVLMIMMSSYVGFCTWVIVDTGITTFCGASFLPGEEVLGTDLCFLFIAKQGMMIYRLVFLHLTFVMYSMPSLGIMLAHALCLAEIMSRLVMFVLPTEQPLWPALCARICIAFGNFWIRSLGLARSLRYVGTDSSSGYGSDSCDHAARPQRNSPVSV